ncbi:TonB-dependent receptor [Gloeocapsopsis sp. IPPAS B-1203]|uniref:TonB-dependent receptor domain-containing protein n=1 Tax=Gloeocapsopsis sp. IPPAS B-1203 TaxID=2049454 RepID=UPI000C176C74|nr:TonB-dependent receptor [Gloeocapsopsis sp. IPPAS B-1203]PIG95268.1 ferric aerobactin receptor [Gloeocapsopsis sp. IPPAS B-1203]
MVQQLDYVWCEAKVKLHLLISYMALLSVGSIPTAIASPKSLNNIANNSYQSLLRNVKQLDKTTQRLSQASPPATEVVQIQGVRLNPTANGLEVILETSTPQKLELSTASENATLIANVVNAQLVLPEGNAFLANDPADGITAVRVVNLDANIIQVQIIGSVTVPQVEVLESDREGLIFSVVPPAAVTEADELNIVVTATRTAEALENVPRSVTTITREQLDDQTTVIRNLPDILGQLVPGFGPPTQNRRTGRLQTLRGRPPLILIDGVVQSTNAGFDRQLNAIDPSAIERIEVVRGPSAVYGQGATGGVINIITRQPTDERLQSELIIGTRTDDELRGEGFGYSLKYGLAGNEGNVDYRINTSLETNGGWFDAEGNRIPPNDIVDTETLNLLAKVGINLDAEQRLELTYDIYRDRVDTEFISDPSILDIPGLQTARALRVGEIAQEEPSRQTNQVASLKYRHENLGGSQLDLQLYYQDTQIAQEIQDIRTFFGDVPPFIPGIFQTNLDQSKWGARLQVETPFSESTRLLWGADYLQEDSDQPFLVIDPVAFDTRREANVLTTATQVPPFQLNSLGVFAQVQWDLSAQWLLSGGLRYETIGFEVNDFFANPFADFDNAPALVSGGSNRVDDVVFNLGSVYKVTDEISFFANFAQGFAVPSLDFLGQATAGFAIEDDNLLQPEKVNNYEIGVRGTWGTVQATLVGFYNHSDLGQNLVIAPSGLTNAARGPQRNYGIEATLDWQPSDRWGFGSSLTWNEGEANFPDDSRGWLALSSLDVQPLKLTAYIENETLPGWRNRLQLLLVGDRDRAFEEEVEEFQIEGYTTLDFISSLQIGQGRLELGIENLLNQQYLPVSSQDGTGIREIVREAARGRTISVRYAIEF